MAKGSFIKPTRLKGFNDILPREADLRAHFMEIMRAIAGRSGYQSIKTPTIEYSETLLGEGGETDKQVYQFLDNGERDVALRYDLTVPFARFAAEHFSKLRMPFKRMEMGQVFRAEKPQKGRYREFCQCDLDIIGVDHFSADLDILLCLSEILTAFDIGPVTMAVNNRYILSGLIRAVYPELNDEAEIQVLIALDKMDKIGAIKVHELLSDIPGTNDPGSQKLLKTMERFAGISCDEFGQVVDFFSESFGKDLAERDLDHVLRMKKTMDVLAHTKLDLNVNFEFNLSIARGLAYYTGIVFETTLDRLENFGSICSGGRYDNLAGRFTSQHLPGVGGSIGLDRLLAGLDDAVFERSTLGTDVFIAVGTEDAVSRAQEVAAEIRRSGKICQVSLQAGRKLSQQLKQADKCSAQFCVIIAEDELAKNTYVLKNMQAGTEDRDISLDELLTRL